MANEIPSVRRLRGIGGVTPFRSVFDRPGVPMYTEQQFAAPPIGTAPPVGTPISPAGYGTPRPAPTVAAQYGLGAARQRLSPAMMQAMQQQRQQQQQPAGFFDSLPSPMSPAGQALGAAATRGLQLSGWQDRPITLGQGLGAMAQAGMQAYTAARKEERAAELAKQQRETDLALKLLEIQGKEATTQREINKITTDREMTRSKDFRTSSKPFGEARLNYGRIVANATTPNPTGATDIALIFNFMKMLDPTSVVRGSEYEAAEGASPLLLRLGQQYNKLFRKEAEKLPEVTRRAFLQAATETFVPYVEGQQRLEKDFIDEAVRFNLDPKNIVRTMVPEQGTKQYPYLVYDIGEAENLPEGSWIMYEGELLQVAR